MLIFEPCVGFGCNFEIDLNNTKLGSEVVCPKCGLKQIFIEYHDSDSHEYYPSLEEVEKIV